MTARVVAVGRPLAGDDAVAFEVARRLREESAPLAAEILETSDPSRLAEWACDVDVVVVVDAVVDGGPAGRVIVVPAEAVGVAPGRVLSTHGMGIAGALALARLVHPETIAERGKIVGVTIGEHRRGAALSPEVAAAVAPAAAAVRRAIAGEAPFSRGRR